MWLECLPRRSFAIKKKKRTAIMTRNANIVNVALVVRTRRLRARRGDEPTAKMESPTAAITCEVRSLALGRRSPAIGCQGRCRDPRTHLLDTAVDINVQLLAEIEAHSVAETLRARRIRWVRQRDEGHPDGRAALAVGVADPVRSRVLRQGHQFIGTLPRDKLCFQVLLPSSVQLHSHLTTSSGAVEELIRHAGGIARRPRCFPGPLLLHRVQPPSVSSN